MNDKIKLNLYSFIAVFLWAAAFPLTKVAGVQFSPYSLGLIRCITASAALLVVGRFIHLRKPFCKKDLLFLCSAGLCGFALYLIFFNTGLLTITAATSSVIIAATPIMTALVSSRLYEERISGIGWLAIACAFAGVIILLFHDGIFSVNVGALWTLGAAVVFCIYNLLNRKLSSIGYSSVEIVTYGMMAAAILLLFSLPDAVSELAQAQPEGVIIAVGLGLFPSATSYVLWAKALELADKTNEVTNYMFITPLLSAVMGFLMLSEIPDTGTFIGGVVIIVSVVLFGLKGK